MKALFTFFCLFTLPTYAAEIVLLNGERITIEANRATTVVCQAGQGSRPGMDLPNTVMEGLEAATVVCSKQYYDSDKSACLKIVGAAKFYALKAVSICSAQYYDSDKKTCLEKIRNKIILNAEADLCDKLYYDSDKVSCLANIERTYE